MGAMLNSYVSSLGRDEVTVPVELHEQMIKELDETLTPRVYPKGFRLRLSAIGKPLCQLKAQKLEWEASMAEPLRQPMRLATGNLLEAYVVMLLRASGLPIDDVQIPATVELAGAHIKGTADIIIGGTVYDIKTASNFSYGKFADGFHAVYDSDPFGYVAQGYLYAKGLNKKFGGWIVVNKNTGDICVCAVPHDDTKYKKEALQKAEDNVRAILADEGFDRCFDDEEETFLKKPTGNRKLGFTCAYCPYKTTCWPQMKTMNSAFSKAMSPARVHYTEYNYAQERNHEGKWDIVDKRKDG